MFGPTRTPQKWCLLVQLIQRVVKGVWCFVGSVRLARHKGVLVGVGFALVQEQKNQECVCLLGLTKTKRHV